MIGIPESVDSRTEEERETMETRRHERWPMVHQFAIDPRAWLDVLSKVRKETPTSSLGVGGAYSSPKDVLKYDEARCLFEATDLILASLPSAPEGHKWEATAWFNVLKKDNAIGKHDHVKTDSGDNAWAAILYVQAPGGSIVFHQEGSEPLAIEPKAGMLLVFPAGLVHSVPTYIADKARVSVAWNVREVKV